MPLKDTAAMKRERQKLIDEMRSITSAAESRENKTLTDAEGEKWSTLNTQVDTMRSEIERCERMNVLEMEGLEDHGDGNEGNHEKEEFRDSEEFIQAVIDAGTPGRSFDRRLESRAITGMNETNPQDGGFLVEKDALGGIGKRMYEVSRLARKCSLVNCSKNSNGISWLSLKEDSRVAGSRGGGIRAYRVAEANTVTQTITQLRRHELNVEKLMAIVPLTEELMQDSTAVLSLVNQIVPDEFAYTVDEEIMNGTGAGQCLGYMKSDSLVSVDAETNQVAGTIVYENIINMYARMWAPSRDRAEWYINQDCEPQLHTMALVVGAGGVPVYMPATSAAPVPMLYGRPLISIEQAKTCGTTGDIVFADLSQYRLVEKGGLKKDESIHVRFIYGENLLRFTKRINGMPMWSSALTPANGTDTLSPTVALATRA